MCFGSVSRRRVNREPGCFETQTETPAMAYALCGIDDYTIYYFVLCRVNDHVQIVIILSYDLSTAAQMKTRIAMLKAGNQKSPVTQRRAPIAIKHPLDFFGLIGCPQFGHFSAECETSLLQAGQVINPAIE